MKTETPMTGSQSSSATTSLSRFRKWAIFVAPALLTMVALMHQVLATTSNLNSWKGGGFGMFATVDGPGTRRIHASVTLVDGSKAVELTPFGVVNKNDGSSKAQSTQIFPSEGALREVAESVLAEYQLYYDNPEIDGDEAAAVTVEIRSIDYDSRTATATQTLVTSLTIEVPQ